MSRPLLDTLFNINCSLSSTPAILEKTRINSAIRFGLRRLANGRQLRAIVTHLASRPLPNPFNLPSPR